MHGISTAVKSPRGSLRWSFVALSSVYVLLRLNGLPIAKAMHLGGSEQRLLPLLTTSSGEIGCLLMHTLPTGSGYQWLPTGTAHVELWCATIRLVYGGCLPTCEVDDQRGDSCSRAHPRGCPFEGLGSIICFRLYEMNEMNE